MDIFISLWLLLTPTQQTRTNELACELNVYKHYISMRGQYFYHPVYLSADQSKCYVLIVCDTIVDLQPQEAFTIEQYPEK